MHFFDSCGRRGKRKNVPSRFEVTFYLDCHHTPDGLRLFLTLPQRRILPRCPFCIKLRLSLVYKRIVY